MFLIKLIKLYQKFLTPFWISFGLVSPSCRFHPTCSDYSCQAINKYGPLLGSLKSAWRILRCSPLSKGGVDLA